MAACTIDNRILKRVGVRERGRDRANLRGVLWLIYSEELKEESKLGTLSILISEEYPLQQYFLFFFFLFMAHLLLPPFFPFLQQRF